MKKIILFALVLALGLATEVANADFTFGEPTPVPNVSSESADTYVHISADGLSLYITSFRPGGYGDQDLWVAKRPTENDEWGTPVNLGPKVNSSGWDACASISADNLVLYFYSQDRPGGYGGFDLWVSTRETTDDDWGEAVNLGPTFNTAGHNWGPNISADNLSLYFSCDRPGGSGSFDMWVSARETIQDDWGTPVNLGSTVNWSGWDCKPDISADGCTLFFTRIMTYHPGEDEDFDIWFTRRETIHDDWGSPVSLPINTSFAAGSTSISADGSTLYFASNRPPTSDGGDIWQVSIEPVVDLNGDGIVDATDMCIVVDHWGEDYSLCDVGPMPWGDGIVDVQDLIVISEHLFEVYPSAETVDVNEADDGGQIELELGKLLVVTLESNPSTGYRWELVENNESILKQFGEVEFKSSETGDPPMVGAGGWEIFRFKAVSAGQMNLELVYHRSWEDVEPLKTFSIQVVVP